MPELSFKQYLSSLPAEKVYFYPNPGNGGDALIASAAVKVFTEIGLNFTIIRKGMDLTGKTVVMGGGGSFVEPYDFYADFIRRWHNQVDILIIAPQTIRGHGELLSEMAGNTVLFCREKTSYDYVRRMVSRNVRVYLDHDLAFYLEPKRETAKYSLKPWLLYLETVLKKRFRDPRTLYAFRDDIEKTNLTAPPDNIDISKRINYCCGQDMIRPVNRTTAEILRFIDFFETVHTNRLHLAIGGYLLDKKVFMYPNSYYKNKAVYEFSLADSDTVCFLS